MHIELRPVLIVDNNPYLKKIAAIDLIWLKGLLKKIEETGGVAGVFEHPPIASKGAWETLTLAENSLLLKLVIRREDRRTRLSNFGILLIQAIEEMQERGALENVGCQETLLKAIEQTRLVENGRWKFFSSSDAIMRQATAQVDCFELKIIDSSEAIHKLLTGEADVAGYNTSSAKYSISIYQHLLKNDKKSFPVAKRIQGLMVRKGNPFDIQSVSDLTNNQIRFINRQKGSGTRILLDELLEEKQIKPNQINGYLEEELQHLSLANAILANKADVGLGVWDVALANGLDFIPLREEIFFIAMKKELVSEPAVAKLISLIRIYSQETPGYGVIYLNQDVEEWTGAPPKD